MKRSTQTVAARVPPELLRKLDSWIARQTGSMTRSEAIRLLLSDRLKHD